MVVEEARSSAAHRSLAIVAVSDFVGSAVAACKSAGDVVSEDAVADSAGPG